MSLQAQLDEIRSRTRELLRPEHLAVTDRAIAELQESGLAKRILPAGATAPDFELPDANGKLVRSSELRARGRLVISFYRGRWCPYCVAQLEALQQVWAQIQAKGASLIAVSPQTQRQTSFAAEQHHLKFPLLSDAGNQVARKFGLVYAIPDYLKQQYKRTFVNLPHCNGDESWELPLPATFVIEPDGKVQFAEAHADYTRRMEPEEILTVLAG
ncbi:MAG TPA: peroxiredoxin-like family protein [Terriglobales bacterium]|jgi:peroxiredoxin|nr:peroxiredoxin-like family protein [Terriglobales bacterium]